MPLIAWIIAALAFTANVTNASILTTARTHDDVVALVADTQSHSAGAIAFSPPASPGNGTAPHASGDILSTHALVGSLPIDESLIHAELTTSQPLTRAAVDAITVPSQQALRVQASAETNELVIREEPPPAIAMRATLIGAVSVLLLTVVCMGCRTVFQEMRRRRHRRTLG